MSNLQATAATADNETENTEIDLCGVSKEQQSENPPYNYNNDCTNSDQLEDFKGLTTAKHPDVQKILNYQAREGEDCEGDGEGEGTIYARMFSQSHNQESKNAVAETDGPPLNLPLLLPSLLPTQYLELEPVIRRHSTSTSDNHLQCPISNANNQFPDLSRFAEAGTDPNIKNIEEIIRKSVIAALTSLKHSKNNSDRVETETKTETETPIVNLTVHIGNNYYPDSDGVYYKHNSINTNKIVTENLNPEIPIPLSTPLFSTSASAGTRLKVPKQVTEPCSGSDKVLNDDGGGGHIGIKRTRQLNIEVSDDNKSHCSQSDNTSPICINKAGNSGTGNTRQIKRDISYDNITNCSPSDNTDNSSHPAVFRRNSTFDSYEVLNLNCEDEESINSVPFTTITSQFLHDRRNGYNCMQDGCKTILRHRQSLRRHWILHYKQFQQRKRNEDLNKLSPYYVASTSTASSCSSSSSRSRSRTSSDNVTATTIASSSSTVGSGSSSSAPSSNGKVSRSAGRSKVRYACIICDAVLSRRDTYQRHMRSHNQNEKSLHLEDNISDVEEEEEEDEAITIESDCDSSNSADEDVQKDGFGKRFGPNNLSRKKLILDDQ